MKTLYNYADDFRQVSEALSEIETSEELINILESYSVPLAQKAENVVKYSQHLVRLAEMQEVEAKELTEASKKNKERSESLIRYLDTAMQVSGLKELQAGVFNLKYHKGREVVQIDVDKLPEDYFVTQEAPPPKPMSKPELKKLVESGEKIAGVTIVRNPDSLKVGK